MLFSILAAQVLLKFHPSFHRAHIPGAAYRVRFGVHRSTFVFLQAALERVAAGRLAPATLLPHLASPPGGLHSADACLGAAGYCAFIQRLICVWGSDKGSALSAAVAKLSILLTGQLANTVTACH